MTMTTQVFTFGCGQIFANGYVIICAASAERCRELMFDAFGTKWSMQYNEVPHGFGMKLIAEIHELPNGKIVTELHETRIELR